MKSVLFICMGNICRSAAAEAVLKRFVELDGQLVDCEIDSAGIIGYHAGERADSRMIESAFKRGYKVTSISRQVTPSDFEKFDYIIAMDDSNVRGLRSVVSNAVEGIYDSLESEKKNQEYLSKISKLTDYCTEEYLSTNGSPTEVPDPYYGGARGFELVLDMLEDASKNIIKELKK